MFILEKIIPELKGLFACLCFGAGLAVCATATESWFGPLPANPARYVVEPDFDHAIYPSRGAFERDREAFVKTICDPQFDGAALGKRGWECA